MKKVFVLLWVVALMFVGPAAQAHHDHGHQHRPDCDGKGPERSCQQVDPQEGPNEAIHDNHGGCNDENEGRKECAPPDEEPEPEPEETNPPEEGPVTPIVTPSQPPEVHVSHEPQVKGVQLVAWRATPPQLAATGSTTMLIGIVGLMLLVGGAVMRIYSRKKKEEIEEISFLMRLRMYDVLREAERARAEKYRSEKARVITIDVPEEVMNR